MTHYTQARVLCAALGLAMLLPGCGEDNQKASKITATVPTDGLSTKERRERASGISDPKSAGYPGTGGATPAGGGGGGGRRKN